MMENCENEALQIKSVKNTSNKDIFVKMSEFFTTYLNDMFTDLSKVIIKKLEDQEKKIINNQKHLKEISKTLQSKSHHSSTSFGDLESQTSLQQKKRKKISSFKQAKDFMSIQKISQILIKMQANVQYLQNSLTKLKTNKHIQDPQTCTNGQQKAFPQQQKTKQTQPTQTTLTSKISKLSTRITKLAKESSIEQIEKQNSSMLRKCHMPKSKSLLSISSRKYHPVSCPKKYEYGSGLGRNWSQSEIDKQSLKDKQYGSKIQGLIDISIPQKNNDNLIGSNKMPLINKANNLLNELLISCQDQADASVIKFHLKKTFKKIDEIITNNKNRQQVDNKNVLTEVNDKQSLTKKINLVPEYFVHKSKETTSLNLTQLQSQQITPLQQQCSIVKNIPTNQQANLNWVKQNYSSFCSKGLNQNDTSLQNYGSTNNSNNLSQTKDSRQKRKYFQRTSNDNKITMLKKKLQSQTVRL